MTHVKSIGGGGGVLKQYNGRNDEAQSTQPGSGGLRAVETVIDALHAHHCSLKHVVEQTGFVLPSLAALGAIGKAILFGAIRVRCAYLGIFAVCQEFVVEWRADSKS